MSEKKKKKKSNKKIKKRKNIQTAYEFQAYLHFDGDFFYSVVGRPFEFPETRVRDRLSWSDCKIDIWNQSGEYDNN